jgi:hypothetical protein
MTYTIQQLNETRAARRERRNRGEAVGNHGIRQLTKTEQAAVDEMRFQGMDELECGIFEIVQSLVFHRASEAEQLRLYLLENEEPNGLIEIPF